MFESLGPAALRKNPYKALVLGVLAVSVSVVLAFFIFRGAPSFPAVFLSSIVAGTAAVSLLEMEGLGTVKGTIWRRHEKLVELYAYIFFGMAAGFAFWYAVLPDTVVTLVFDAQLENVAIGYFVFSLPLLFSIISNNLGLIFSFFLLSFFRGYGSIFLLSWNASVLGLVWGNAVRSVTSSPVALQNVLFMWPYLVPEVLAYFLAAIAGGLIFFNLDRGLKRINRDAYIFMSVAIFLIVLAGIIETVVLSLV